MNQTIALCNLGCSKNIIDGERIASFLEQSGFSLIDSYPSAEIIIVNTCSFIREATREAIDTILEMAEYKKSGRCKTLIAAGCFSERYRKEAAAAIPEVDVWVGVHAWQEELSDFFQASPAISFQRSLSEPIATQYCKIADGCSHRCSFCVIPSIRGPYRSRGVQEIVAEAQWLEGRGAKELILVSQDTSWYGRDIGVSLTGMLETLLRKTGFAWIRLMYLHPAWIDDSLLRLIGSEQRMCGYFDIPLQHAADSLLTAMKRGHRAADLYSLIERIRNTAPDAAIRSSFILGFPGETKVHFKKLLDFIEWARFDKLGVFPYSPEEGTVAATMRPMPRSATAIKRCEEIMAVQREISRELLEKRIGQRAPVIIDRISDIPDYAYEGRTERDAPEVDGKVHIIDGSAEPGQILEARIVDTDDYDLFARI